MGYFININNNNNDNNNYNNNNNNNYNNNIENILYYVNINIIFNLCHYY
jgi:hypothetical protein